MQEPMKVNISYRVTDVIMTYYEFFLDNVNQSMWLC